LYLNTKVIILGLRDKKGKEKAKNNTGKRASEGLRIQSSNL
jgi:hypothetical protein